MNAKRKAGHFQFTCVTSAKDATVQLARRRIAAIHVVKSIARIVPKLRNVLGMSVTNSYAAIV